jgi:predicted amidohydrolase YtcJ
MPKAAGLIITNAKVFTSDGNNPNAKAVAVREIELYLSEAMSM